MALTEAQKRNAEKNKKYWSSREEEQLKHNITDEVEYDKQIKKIYENMLDGVQEQIDSFYGRYASKEGISIAEAKKRASQLEIERYERKAKQYVKDKDFSAEANEEMRLYNMTMKVNRLELLKANIGLELISGHDELQKFMDKILQGRTEDELKRQAGILGKTITNNAQKAHAIVNGSFHNATFSNRIWMYQNMLRADLDKLLQTGLIQGKNPRAIASELRKHLLGDKYGKGATYNMERLMRTELARVQTEAQKQSFERNGFDEYVFIVNGGCCPICEQVAKRNSGVYKVAKMMPGTNAPPMHPNCRCSTAAHSNRADYDAWLDYLSKGGTTEEWNKLQEKPKAKTKPEEKVQPKEKEISNISETNDFEGLSNYLKKVYNISVDDTVRQLHFESVKGALSGVESVMKETGGLLDTIKKVTTSKSGVMSCSGENITFNPHYFKDDGAKIQKSCEDMSKSRFWIPNSSPASIGAHETAHAIEWMMLHKGSAYEYEWQRIDAWNKCTEAKKLVSQACKNVKKTPYGKGKVNAVLIGNISRYGQENASETMAEAFADVFANGENANPLSAEIKRLTLETLESYKGG